jgi:hypothetical protein
MKSIIPRNTPHYSLSPNCSPHAILKNPTTASAFFSTVAAGQILQKPTTTIATPTLPLRFFLLNL